MPCSTSNARPRAVCIAANLYRPSGSRRNTKSTHRLHSTQTPSKTMILSAMLCQPALVMHEQPDARDPGTCVEAVTPVDDRLERGAGGKPCCRQRHEQESHALESPHD